MIFSESLKKNRDFQNVYKKGKSFANKYLVMYVLENKYDINKSSTDQDGMNRLGISVSKKVGNSVVRHRLTRLIRESYRLQESRFQRGLDIVVICRASAKGKSYSEMESALIHLGKLHNIIDDQAEM